MQAIKFILASLFFLLFISNEIDARWCNGKCEALLLKEINSSHDDEACGSVENALPAIKLNLQAKPPSVVLLEPTKSSTDTEHRIAAGTSIINQLYDNQYITLHERVSDQAVYRLTAKGVKAFKNLDYYYGSTTVCLGYLKALDILTDIEKKGSVNKGNAIAEFIPNELGDFLGLVRVQFEQEISYTIKNQLFKNDKARTRVDWIKLGCKGAGVESQAPKLCPSQG